MVCSVSSLKGVTRATILPARVFMNNEFTVVKFTVGKFYIFSGENGKNAEKI
jgi:hypothetical protein